MNMRVRQKRNDDKLLVESRPCRQCDMSCSNTASCRTPARPSRIPPLDGYRDMTYILSSLPSSRDLCNSNLSKTAHSSEARFSVLEESSVIGCEVWGSIGVPQQLNLLIHRNVNVMWRPNKRVLWVKGYIKISLNKTGRPCAMIV